MKKQIQLRNFLKKSSNFVIIFMPLFFYFLPALAYLVPNDTDYKILKEEKYQYILPSDQLRDFTQIKNYSDFITPLYESEYGWIIDEKTSIVLASKWNQIPNAFAMSTPNSLTVYYSGGVEFLEGSASSSWLFLLSTHERAHIYQLNVKQNPAKQLKYIFGNDPLVFIPFFPWPIFMTPNQFLPTFLVEGNAVLNESRFQNGGRLYSGEARATVLNLVLNDKADLKFIMNDNLNFPFGSEKYLVGGYFQNFLSGKFGIQKVNSFFSQNASRYLNPFLLKTSFAETFYQSYEKLYNEFLAEMRNSYSTFNKAKGTKVASSIKEIIFNRSKDGKKIIFTTQKDGKNRNILNILDSQGVPLIERSTLLKSGKVFEVADNEYQSVGSDYIDRTKYLFSLFDEQQKSNSLYEGKYVHDMKQGHVSYFLMADSIDTGELYLDSEFIAKTESKSLIDHENNIYYFKQNKNKRELFINKTKLTEFEGYFSILQDVLDKNEIYFTANTSNGSGLYCFCQGNIKKILDSDNISRAIKLDKGFLVSAIEPDGYSVNVVDRAIENVEVPFVYKYPTFTRAPGTARLPNLDNLRKTESDFRNYFSLRELRFHRFAPSLYFNREEFLWLNNFGFTDPLFWSSLDFGFSFSNNQSFNYINFNYSPYLVDFFTSATNETWNFNTTKLSKEYRTDSSVDIGIDYPIFKNSFHELSSGLILQNRNLGLDSYFNQKVFFKYTYQENYLLNYDSYQYFSFRPSIYKKNDSLILNVLTEFSYYLGYDFYFSGGLSYLEEKASLLKYNLNQLSSPKFKDRLSLLSFSPSLLIEKLEQQQLILKKEIPYSIYYYRFPLSVRRVAPYIGLQDNKSYDIDSDYLKERLIFANIGIEAELLLFHRMPVRINILNSEIYSKNQKENFTQFQLERVF